MNGVWCMLDGSWLMAQGSWLMAKGGQGGLMAHGQGPARPRGPKGERGRARTWGLLLGPRGRAGPWPWAMSLPWPPLAMSHEPWAMSHEPSNMHQGHRFSMDFPWIFHGGRRPTKNVGWCGGGGSPPRKNKIVPYGNWGGFDKTEVCGKMVRNFFGPACVGSGLTK